jgi:3',5'-cyclic-AMP phosphodiesterase
MALGAGFAARLFADGPAPGRWALISDTHCPADPKDVYRGFNPQENLRTTAAAAAKSPAQFCALTGDVARSQGLPADYDAFRELMAPVLDKMPVGLTTGNHDNRSNFDKAFSAAQGTRQQVARKRVIAFEWTDLRAVFLDSLLDTTVTPGQLGVAQRRWLADYARADQRPALLFLHHDMRGEDGSLVDAAQLLDIVTPLTQVKAVFYGHTHEYGVETRQGLHLVNVPSAAYNFRDQDPVGWMEMTISGARAELLLHATGGNTTMDGTKASLPWR